MSEAQSFATLKQSSNLKQTEGDANFSPLGAPYRPSRGANEQAKPPQMRIEENPVLQQILKNIVTQSEVNAALLNRLLEQEKRIARLEDRLKSLEALSS